ncbi:apolipoprotein N-acyltransferase [Streptomyces orinoci]|uniref:apolipoprotein N-acyltransferase n=1 Tax=Streptomyces orinoci TaxID=67339 RepID=UPI003BAD811F
MPPGSPSAAGVSGEPATGQAAEPPASAASAPAAARPGRAARFAALARREARRTVAALAGGVVLVFAFPPYDLWPLSLVSVALLSLLTHGRTARQGAWTGFAFALPFFCLLLRWLDVVGYDAVAGLSVVEALYVAAMGAGLAVTSRLRCWPLWAAALWVAQELVRDRWPLGGFPWGRLAFANTGSPFTPLAALGGAPLVSFAVALSGTLLACAVLGAVRAGAGRGIRALLPAAGAVALAVALVFAGYAVPVPVKGDDSVNIAVVQGNVQKPGMDFLGRPMMILNNHVNATLQLAKDVKAGRAPRPDLVIWPENASDLDPFKFPEVYDRITEAVQAIGVPVLVGALIDHPSKPGYVFNEGIVWDPGTGPGASYTKQHPVPFGEYVPFREELSKVISRFKRVPRNFYPGDHNGVMKVGPAELGDVICFEVAYDGIVRQTVNAGARMLVVQTNNATFGRSGQPEQQLAMSRLRAVEHGRSVVTAATSGISAVVGPDGQVREQAPLFTRQVINASIPLRDGTTVADRLGEAPEWTLAMVGLLSCAAAVWAGRRGRTEKEGA